METGVRRIKLTWMAIGVGLASFVFLLFQIWQTPKADPRFLYVSVSSEPGSLERAIAAVGACSGRFNVSLPSHGFLIVFPIKELNAEDLICLTEKLQPVRHTMFIKERGA